MKKWLCIVAILGFFGCSSDRKYQLVICTMFKNEAPWLKEWLVYHHDVLGVEHFYLYNNDSTDNYAEVLKPFVDRGIVEVINWSSTDENHSIQGLYAWNTDFVSYQLGAFNDCLKKRALGNAKWVAVIDIDEFIVPVHGIRSFYSHLRHSEKRGRGTIRLNWRVFGTSNIWDLEKGDLLTEKLHLRNQNDHFWNGLQKCIHRPEAIEMCHIHEAIRHKEFPGKTADPDELIRINHYWTRTEKNCLEYRKLNKSENPEFFDPLNQVEDRTIQQYIPALKKALEAY